MEFLILGPIEARNAAGAVALGGNKPRAVLAVLLLHANEPVSADRLALALWGEDAPGGAVKTVQVHVSRLRKALGDGDVVTTTPAGYRLRVRAGQLDADRFETLVEDGRRAFADRRFDDASAILRRALALWRGPALAELSLEPFAGAEISRLDEQRLAALELRVEADLAAGRHGELVGELGQLVEDYPLREKLAGQLMLALYRGGRQTEALEAYAVARRVLVAEVGVEPGPPLRELHEAILRQDVALESQPTAPELPAALDMTTEQPFVGRDRELAWLLAHWELARIGTGALVALTGVQGIGKSRLVAELAACLLGPGVSIVYATGEGPADTLLVALRRAREATRPTLLVIDDADRAGAAVVTELERLAPQLTTVPVLAVACARQPLGLAHLRAGEMLELGALGSDAVRAIASRYAPGKADAEVPADWLLEASAGVASRVHEAASQWSRREAARHVGAVAGRAASSRAELRTLEAELTGGVVELQETRERTPPREEDDAPVVCPFKGLAAYDVDDARYFYGRERLVAEIVTRLVGAPLLGVIGPSGSGKSSVLRAGVLPALADDVIPGSANWSQVLLRPGAHPLRELATALAGVDDGARVVLAIDQFEETFTVCDDERERTEFVSELVHAALDPQRRYVVLLALRADFYGRCAAYPELSDLLASSNVLVGPLLNDELRSAVEGPARRARLRVEPELVDALVADVELEPGGLPLMSTALLELWQHRDGRRLRHSDYQRLGGVHRAVARLAEQAYAQLDGGQQAAARDMLMRLVGAGEGDAIERRRVPLDELEIDRDEDVARALALFTDRRLLTVGAGSVELAHEALLREWPRLRDWIEADRDGLRIRRGLNAAAREWEQLRRDPGALYRGARLAEAIEWRAGRDPSLNELERGFLALSEAGLRRERVTRRRRAALMFGSIGLTAAAAAVVAVIVVLTGHARDVVASRDIAARSATVLGTDPGLALATALAAEHRHDTEQARGAVRQAALVDRMVAVLQVAHGSVYHVALSTDGRLAATAAKDGSVRIWNLAGKRPVATLKGKDGPAFGVSLSRDGKLVAMTYYDGVVAVADVDGTHRRSLAHLGGSDFATGADFSPDGSTLVVATAGGEVRLLRVRAGGRSGLLGRLTTASSVSFDESGTHVVAAGSSSGPALVWSLAKGHPVALPDAAEVNGASFSPDGHRVALGDEKGFVSIWDLATVRRTAHFRVLNRLGVFSVRFSADGERVVTAGEDGAVRVSDARTGVLLDELHGHLGPVRDAAFVPRSRHVVSVGDDGTLRVYDPAAVTGIPQPSTGLDFNGGRVVTGDADGHVRLWDVRTGSVRTLGTHRYGGPNVASFSPDGRQVISASEDDSVLLFDLRTGHERTVALPSDESKAYAAAIDPTGRVVALGGQGIPLVLQAPDGADRRMLGSAGDPAYAVAFSPDGQHVVAGYLGASARIWNVRTGRLERTLRGHTEAVESVGYSDDGRRIVTAGDDGTIRVWPVRGGKPVVLLGHDGRVNSAAFDHAGDRIVSAGDDGTVRIWDPRGGAPLVVLERHDGPAYDAVFGAGGRSVVSGGDDAIKVTPCEMCGSFADTLRVARTRAARTLSPDERARLLGG